jgi:hypothetical protein
MQTEGTATRSGLAAAPLRVARRMATRETAAVAALSLIPALLYLPFLNEPLFGDEAVYSAIERGLLDGQLPYRDLFDNKPPVLYGWFALSFMLFGDEPWAPRLLAAVTLSGTSALVHVQARLLFSRRAAYGASLAFGATAALSVLMANATSEIFTLLPMTGSLVATTVAVQQPPRAMAAAGRHPGRAGPDDEAGRALERPRPRWLHARLELAQRGGAVATPAPRNAARCTFVSRAV